MRIEASILMTRFFRSVAFSWKDGLYWLSGVLLVLGGINWGLVSLFNIDLFAAAVCLDYGQSNGFTRIIHGGIGLSALYHGLTFFMTSPQESPQGHKDVSNISRRGDTPLGAPPNASPKSL